MKLRKFNESSEPEGVEKDVVKALKGTVLGDEGQSQIRSGKRL